MSLEDIMFHRPSKVAKRVPPWWLSDCVLLFACGMSGSQQVCVEASRPVLAKSCLQDNEA